MVQVEIEIAGAICPHANPGGEMDGIHEILRGCQMGRPMIG